MQATSGAIDMRRRRAGLGKPRVWLIFKVEYMDLWGVSRRGAPERIVPEHIDLRPILRRGLQHSEHNYVCCCFSAVRPR